MSDGLLRLVTDSADATVGGGSASALAGAMAAGLVGMVARLSRDRGLRLGDDELSAAADETDRLGRALLAGAQEDADAYGLVKAAYALPRTETRPAQRAWRRSRRPLRSPPAYRSKTRAARCASGRSGRR